MHKRTSAVVLVVALLISLAIAAPALSSSADRPLSGSFVGSGATFQGKLSHLGKFTGQLTGSASSTWTAANGDEVHTVTTSFVITGSNPSSGLLTYEQHIQIAGGTGRFSDASGSAVVTGETASDFSYYFGDIRGTIGY